VEYPPPPKVHQLVFERTRSGSCSFIYRSTVPQLRQLASPDDAVVQIRPRYHGEGSRYTEEEVIFVYGYNEAAIEDKLNKHCASVGFVPEETGHPRPGLVVQGGGSFSPSQDFRTGPLPPMFPEPPEMEVTPLHNSGPPHNRANLVFFGDGYTLEEKDKFLNDSKRLAQDLIANQTFATVNPLINIWAAFTPSNESGVGVGGKPKDTVYGLFRDGTELRAVYAKNELLVLAACLKMNECDYPILLGNDPLYGGLGGLVTITTSSQENGALVLRHELGHSVILVGEEYDGGFEYSGVNAESDLEDGVKWNHWLSGEDKSVRAERSVMPLQGYPWTILNHSEPYTANFVSSGAYSRYLVRFSLSGLPNSDNLQVRLDGEDLGWEPKPGIGVDRWHYDIYMDTPLSGGEHSLEFALQESGDESVAQLCSFEILEFGDEKEFNTSFGHISAYPTYSIDNHTSYRPTNEQCLMRIVTSPNFCSPCIEGLWLSLFNRINLVDGLGGVCHKPDDHSDEYHYKMDLHVIPLAQLRNDTPSLDLDKLKHHESLNITWSNSETGEVYSDYQNSTTFMLKDSDVQKWIRMDIEFHTDEVRSDPGGMLKRLWFILNFNTCEEILNPKVIVTQDASLLDMDISDLESLLSM